MSDSISVELIIDMNQANSQALLDVCNLHPDELAQVEKGTLFDSYRIISKNGYGRFETAIDQAGELAVPLAVVDYGDSDFGKEPTQIFIAGPGLASYQEIQGDDPEQGRAFHRELAKQTYAGLPSRCQKIFLVAAAEAGWATPEELQASSPAAPTL